MKTDIPSEHFPEFERKFRDFLAREFDVQCIEYLHLLCLEKEGNCHVVIDMHCKRGDCESCRSLLEKILK